MKKVSIIIVNWNGINDTVNCLKSIGYAVKKNIQLEIIVVDNGSTDDSVNVIINKYPRVIILQAGNNLGFTGGNNIGIHYAMERGSDFLWLLNNDTILEKNALLLLYAFDDAAVGIAGSKIYFAPGQEYQKNRYKIGERGRVLWYAGGNVDWNNMYASHRGVDEVDHGQYDTREETPFVTGCSFMIRRSVIEQIGVLDDRYYLYLEDLDYCLRAKRAGYRLVYEPKSVVWHVNAGSSGGAGNPLHEYYLTRNRLLIGMRFAPLRTKIALAKESGKFIFGISQIKRRAVLNALSGKWGKQYESKKFNA